MSEIITRRSLPHWYVPGAAHFITFRLYGSLSSTFLEKMQKEKHRLIQRPLSESQTSAGQRKTIHKKLFSRFDAQLDNATENLWLAETAVASMVRASLFFHHEKKYQLLAYTIMGNHVHLLLLPLLEHRARQDYADADLGEVRDKGNLLAAIMHSLKSYTAHEANKILNRGGQFWQHESYDHWVRDDDEMERVVDYINLNAVRAGLVKSPHEYPWCSARDRFLLDGDSSGWIKTS